MEVYSKITEFKTLSKTRNPWSYFINDLTNSLENNEAIEKRLINLDPKSAYEVFLRLNTFGYKIELPFDAKFSGKGKPILRIPADDTIKFPPVVRKIVDTPEFQRLRGVKQLGLTNLTFPGATHDRFTHSLGVYFRTTKYLNSLTTDPLFSYLYSKEEIETTAIYALIHDIGHYPFAHYFEEKTVGQISKNIFHHESVGKKI